MDEAHSREPRLEPPASGLMQSPGARPQPPLMGTHDAHPTARHLMAFDATLEGPTAVEIAWLVAIIAALVLAVLLAQAR